jgi:hypothetical protein
MSPSSDHELEIARIVDGIAREGRLKLRSMQEVITTIDFFMTGPDGEFLVNYVIWRMHHLLWRKCPWWRVYFADHNAKLCPGARSAEHHRAESNARGGVRISRQPGGWPSRERHQSERQTCCGGR